MVFDNLIVLRIIHNSALNDFSFWNCVVVVSLYSQKVIIPIKCFNEMSGCQFL